MVNNALTLIIIGYLLFEMVQVQEHNKLDNSHTLGFVS